MVNNLFLDIEDISSDEKLKNSKQTSWVEESLYFDVATGKQTAQNFSLKYVGNNFSWRKGRFLLWFLFLVCGAILLELIYLQLFKGGDYRLAAENNRQRIIPIPSERGLIFDRNNKSLTENIPNFSLAVVPQILPRSAEARLPIINKLAEIIQENPEDIKSILNEYGSYSYESIIIKENIPYDTALSILIATADLPGIEIQRGSKRLYFFEQNASSTANSLAHVLGYINKLNREELDRLYNQGYYPADAIGKTGVEKTYESFLRGTYGKRRIEVDARGREQSVLAEQAPSPGFHLQLAIDYQMQKKLEEILQHYLKTANKNRASGIVLNPNTGEVLALVSLPTFDNNDFSGGISYQKYQDYLNNEDNPLFARAIGGIYPSGSTIKPAIAAGALQEGVINASTSFLSNGGIQVVQWFFPDWQAGGHGVTNVRKALAWSVNTFFYYIGGGYKDFVGLGIDKIVNSLRKFGFAEKTGIDLPGEASGFLPTKEWKVEAKGEIWYIGDTYNVSIGQGDVLVSPLQIANMTVAIANQGTLYRPHVVKAVIDPISDDKQEIDPEVIRSNFINSNYLQIVRLGMQDCVEYGSCRRLSLLPFSSAGKTGTAQWSSLKENHAWFTSFAPFDNPQIVVTIMVEEGGDGSAISVPIAYDFYRWWWSYLGN